MRAWVEITRKVSIVNLSCQTLLLGHNMGRFHAWTLYAVTINYKFHCFCYHCQTMLQLFPSDCWHGENRVGSFSAYNVLRALFTSWKHALYYCQLVPNYFSFSQGKQRGSLRVYTLEALWVLLILAKFFNIGIAVGLKIPLIQDVLLLLIPPMMTDVEDTLTSDAADIYRILSIITNLTAYACFIHPL